MRRISLTLLMLGVAALSVTSCAKKSGYQLVWADEFNDPQINTDNWEHMIGDGTEYGIPGWGNEELEYYTERPGNSYIEDGKLVIAALAEDYQGFKYTSARMRTVNKQDFLYGRIEGRIQLPSAKGMWPAFWMLPTDFEYGGWAASGEVDILESVNAKPDRVMGSIFFGGEWPRQDHISRFSTPLVDDNGEVVDLGATYHTYTLEWQPYEMRWYLDDELYSVQNDWNSENGPYPAPFDKPFHLLLNIAVGGNGPGGPPDETTDWPNAKMYVDWIRVYQTDNQPPEIHYAGIPDAADGLVRLMVDASDPDGRIDRVEFHQGEELIGTDTDAPYALDWQAEDGCYTIRIKAIDDEDFVSFTESDLVVGVGCPPGPYHVVPAAIPGRIEAEDFDRGEPGVAHFDKDPSNNGGEYRLNEPVDVQLCDEGGYVLGWMEDEEWLNYAVNVAEAGSYDITLRVGSPEGAARFHVEFDGVDKTGIQQAPKTGDWQTYTDHVIEGVHLSAGEQTMRLLIDKGGFNLNYIEIESAD